MVYLPHYRLRVGGTMPGAGTWTVTTAWANSDSSDPGVGTAGGVQADLEAWVDQIKLLNGGSVVPTDIQSLIGGADITLIRASHIGADGREDALAQAEGVFFRTGASPKMPNQVSLAVSLITTRPGSSYRGRIYWPACQATLAATGLVPTATCAAIATASGQWLKDLSGAAQNGPIVNTLVPMVASATRSALTQVLRVRVGNRLDSQRRRAEGQDEAYSVAAIPN